MMSESEEEVIISKNKKKKKPRNKKDNKEMTFVKKKTETGDEEDEAESENSFNKKASKEHLEDNRPYKKIKHIFEIKVKELKNIPILDKLIKDISRNEIASST